MSTYTIVGCGQTAKDWIPRGHSIGVNDAWKWGKPTDSLVVCNRPSQFGKDRYQTIVNSTPQYFYTQGDAWPMHVKAPKISRKSRLISTNPIHPETRFIHWSGTLYPETVFFSNTSPFIAISLAFFLGAKEIIMWGCDFVDHKIYNSGEPSTVRQEVEVYMDLIREMKIQGCQVYLGAKGTAFDNLIPLYDKAHSSIPE